ncbi:ATP-binding protein [Bifidobacterium santillanense]|nr:ATP-binding protein [Bifidobacterium santillanense]
MEPEHDPTAMMHALNPFMPGAGRKPRELAGREPELEIMDRIIARTKAGYSDRGLICSGLRGVGKTVLLLRMRDMALAQGLMAVRMEATSDARRDYELLLGGLSKAVLRERNKSLRERLLDVLKHVNDVSIELGAFGISLKTADDAPASSDSLQLEMMVEELCRELKKRHSGLLLFIDEFQEMPNDLMGTIIGLQHAMGQDDLPFYVIAAGLPNLPGVLTKSRSYAERLFQYRKIGRLTESQTKECFIDTMKGVSTFEDDALDRLIQLSQGYPYFIQAYGSAAFEASDSSPIPLSAVNRGEATARASIDDGLYESRWQRASQSERTYMRVMAELGKEVCSSSEIADKAGKTTPELSRTRKRLIEAGLAYSPERGLIAFTVPGMGEYIRRISPSEEQAYGSDRADARASRG